MAGWYAAGPGLLAYWDGYSWTRTRVVPPVRVRYRRTNHAAHLVLSVVTLGAWLPIWAARSGGRYCIVR